MDLRHAGDLACPQATHQKLHLGEDVLVLGCGGLVLLFRGIAWVHSNLEKDIGPGT